MSNQAHTTPLPVSSPLLSWRRRTNPPTSGRRRDQHQHRDIEDFVISLKMLAVKRAETTVCPYLAGAFDLRTLRAIGVILLDGFKEQLKETAVDPTVLDRLALSRDPDVDANVTVSSNDFEVYRRHSKDQPKPNSVKRK
uniref:Uncharacterized protein n=5 Tax=Avena sativa TaxID=4498 RepID=A0ACD5UVM3_AVESA